MAVEKLNLFLLYDLVPKEIKACVHTNIWIQMFTVPLYIIAKIWKQPKYLSIDEKSLKPWYVHRMRYYSAKRRNELLIHATKWMNLMIKMPRKRSQTKKGTFCTIPSTQNSRKCKWTYRDRKMSVCLESAICGEERWRL